MITEEFTRKDGTTGESYKPEAGDEVTLNADKVFEREYLGVRKEDNTPFKSVKYGIAVITKDGKEVFLSLTAGQKKGLDKTSDLMGKKVVFYEYENDFGKQVGCKVQD